jgi:hypothetical protein
MKTKNLLSSNTLSKDDVKDDKEAISKGKLIKKLNF